MHAASSTDLPSTMPVVTLVGPLRPRRQPSAGHAGAAVEPRSTASLPLRLFALWHLHVGHHLGHEVRMLCL